MRAASCQTRGLSEQAHYRDRWARMQTALHYRACLFRKFCETVNIVLDRSRDACIISYKTGGSCSLDWDSVHTAIHKRFNFF
jgi:hypothetical protein